MHPCQSRQKHSSPEIKKNSFDRDVNREEVSLSLNLTVVIMSHSNVMSNHMCHCPSQKVRLVSVDVDTYSNSFSCANCFWHRHSRFTSGKVFTTESRRMERNKKGEQKKKLNVIEFYTFLLTFNYVKSCVVSLSILINFLDV